MLIVVLFFLAISSMAIVFLRRDKQTWLLLGLCLSFVCMFSGIIIYIAKTGGMQSEQKFLLFLDGRIERKLSYLALPLKKLGYLIAVGRTLFPGFLLMIASNYSMSQKLLPYKRKAIFAMLVPLATLVLYYPDIFLSMSSGMQLLIINVTVVWIAVYLLTALILLIIEYRGITIPYCKKQFAYIMGFLISIGIMYCFYFRQDPIQVFQMYSAEYIHFGGLLYTTTFGMNVSRWVIFSAFTMVFGIFGFFSLRNYTMLEQQEVEGDLMIQKKFDMASRGISVFVHGMKNQLLSNRVLCDRIKNEFAKEEPDIAKIRQYSEGISDTNTNMLKRMEELYKSIKSNYLTLHPVDVSEVLDRALYRFHEKYPDVVVGISIETTSQLLADLSHLSEACYNLLINGYEAILESGKEIQHLAIRVYDERLYVTFVISDNGKGMSRRVQKKIYDPFYTSKNTNNNWGMGLYYVRQIIKSHMGILRVESAEGEGTKFFVSIPKYGTQTKGRKQHDKNTDS